jgi:hypothetical protein
MSEDVEAHRKAAATEEPSSEETEDVEAHRRKKAMTDEPRSDDEGRDDDVEAHARKKV